MFAAAGGVGRRLAELALLGPLGPLATGAAGRAVRGLARFGLAGALGRARRALGKRKLAAAAAALSMWHARARRRTRLRRVLFAQLLRDMSRSDLDALVRMHKRRSEFSSKFRWLYLDDTLRMRWLNTLMGTFWLLAESTGDEMVARFVDPVLEELAYPKGISEIRLDTFKLGSTAPKISQANIVSSSRFTRDGLAVDCTTLWNGEPEVVISVRGPALGSGVLAVSLDNLIIKGTLRVFLHPFTTEPPYFFESASVMFIAPPTISYSISVQAVAGLPSMSIGSVPGLSGVLTKLVETLVAKRLVFPRCIDVPLKEKKPERRANAGTPLNAEPQPSAEPGSKRKASKQSHALGPIGTLQVELCGAKGLMRTDLFSSSDPFCVLGIGVGLPAVFHHPFRAASKAAVQPCSAHPHAARSSVKMDTLSPEWNEVYEFEIRDPSIESLCIEVYDYDKFAARGWTSLGVATVPLDQRCGASHVYRKPISAPLFLSDIQRNQLRFYSKNREDTETVGEVQIRLSWTLHAEGGVVAFAPSARDDALACIGTRVQGLESHCILTKYFVDMLKRAMSKAEEDNRSPPSGLQTSMSSNAQDHAFRAMKQTIEGEPTPLPAGCLAQLEKRDRLLLRNMVGALPRDGLPGFAVTPSTDRGALLNLYMSEAWPMFTARVIHECDLCNEAARRGQLWGSALERWLRPRARLFPGVFPPILTGISMHELHKKAMLALMGDVHLRFANDGFAALSIAPLGLESCRLSMEWSEMQAEFVLRGTAAPLLPVKPYAGSFSLQLMDPNIFSWMDSCFTLRVREPFSALFRAIRSPARAIHEVISGAEPEPDNPPARTLTFRPMDHIPGLGLAFHAYCRRVAYATAGYPNVLDFNFVDLDSRAVQSHLDLAQIAGGIVTVRIMRVRGIASLTEKARGSPRAKKSVPVSIRITVEAACAVTHRLGYESRTLRIRVPSSCLDSGSGGADLDEDSATLASVYTKRGSLRVAVGVYEDNATSHPDVQANDKDNSSHDSSSNGSQNPLGQTSYNKAATFDQRVQVNASVFRSLGQTERRAKPISDSESSRALPTLKRVEHMYRHVGGTQALPKKLPAYRTRTDANDADKPTKRKAHSLATRVYNLIFKRLRPIYLGQATLEKLNATDKARANIRKDANGRARARRNSHKNRKATAEAEAHAATVVQAHWRARQARDLCATRRSNLEREIRAVTKLQAVWRGHVARRRLQREGIQLGRNRRRGTATERVHRRRSAAPAPAEQILREVGRGGDSMVAMAYFDAAAAAAASTSATVDRTSSAQGGLDALITDSSKCLRARTWLPLEGFVGALSPGATPPMVEVEVRLARFSDDATQPPTSTAKDLEREPTPGDADDNAVCDLTRPMTSQLQCGCLFVEVLRCDNLAPSRALFSKVEVRVGSRTRRTARFKGHSFAVGELFLFPGIELDEQHSEKVVVHVERWMPAWRRTFGGDTSLGSASVELRATVQGQIRRRVYLAGGPVDRSPTVDLQLSWRAHAYITTHEGVHHDIRGHSLDIID